MNISNPVAMPNQNPRKPFPAWRLPKGMIKASDEELEKSIDSCERWEWFGGGLVFFGVSAAVAIAAIHPKYDSFLEQWGSAIADGLVASGVGIEIKFGQMAGLRQNELKRRSDEKVAEANVRAAEADEKAQEANERAATIDLARVELEKSLAARRLTKEQKEALQSLKGKVAAVNVAHISGDSESWHFATDIAFALHDAGIRVTEYARGPGILMAGASLYDKNAFMPNWENLGGESSRGEPITSAMKDAGIFWMDMPLVHCVFPTDINAPDDIPIILIGEKPPIPSPTPPASAGDIIIRMAAPTEGTEK